MCFNSKYKNLELAWGGHTFCSAVVIDKKIEDDLKEEIEEESEWFQVMCFVLRFNQDL